MESLMSLSGMIFFVFIVLAPGLQQCTLNHGWFHFSSPLLNLQHTQFYWVHKNTSIQGKKYNNTNDIKTRKVVATLGWLC